MRSTFTYERLAQGEVHPAPEPGDTERLAELQEQDRQFLRRHPAEGLPSLPRRTPLWTSVLAAAAVLVALSVGTLLPGRAEDDTRVKSGAQSLTGLPQDRGRQ